jgi:hypothetical protein
LFKKITLIESLNPVEKIEDFAKRLPQPLISAKLCPERTEQTQYFTEPLPIPKRTPAVFFVSGVEGKMRIQILDSFFSLRCRKRFRYSSCFWVILPDSFATTEKSPNAKESGCF